MTTTPEITYKETEAGYELEFVAPGANKDNVNIEIHNGILTFEAKPAFDVGDRQLVSRPFFPTEYMQRLQLGDDIDPDKVSATVKNGFVTVSLSKKAETSPRKINIGG